MDPLSIVVGLVVAAIILMIVDRLGLGLSVGGFFNALLAAAAIAVVSWAVDWVLAQAGVSLSASEPVLNAIIYLIVSAVVLYVAARLIPGFRTSGFSGAFVAAIAIAVIVWVLSAVFGGLTLPFYGR